MPMPHHVGINDFISAGHRNDFGFHEADEYPGAGIALGASKRTAPEGTINMNVTIGYHFRTCRYRTQDNQISALRIDLLPSSDWCGMDPGRDAWLWIDRGLRFR